MNSINLNLILSDIVTTLNIYVVVKTLSKIQFNKKKFILFSLFVYLLYIINYIMFSGLYRTIFSLIIIITSTYIFLFSKNFKKALYYSIIHFLICLFVEIIVTLAITLIVKLIPNGNYNIKDSLFFFSLLVFILSTLISNISIVKDKIHYYEGKITINKSDKVYILILFILILLLSFNNYIEFGFNISYYMNIIIIIFVVLTVILFAKNKIKMEKFESQYKEMMEYVSKYEKIINEQGKKNHEFNNQLMVLNGYIDNKKKLKEYLEAIIKEHKGGKNYTIEQLSYFPDGGIKGLIYHKLSRMEENNIKPYLYVDKSVKDIFETKFDVNMYSDITKLFGVFLDNAIDASKNAEQKEIEIDMKKDKDYLIVTISNTFAKDVDINKIGNKGFTTKGIGHGFGLSIVRDISKKNNKIETFNGVDKNMFKQTIIIDLK